MTFVDAFEHTLYISTEKYGNVEQIHIGTWSVPVLRSKDISIWFVYLKFKYILNMRIHFRLYNLNWF